MNGAANRVSSTINFLAQAEVYQFQVALGIDHQIFRLQITVNYPSLVEFFQHQYHLAGVKHRDGLVESLLMAEEREELTTWDVLLDDEQTAIVLQQVHELREAWRVQPAQYSKFVT